MKRHVTIVDVIGCLAGSGLWALAGHNAICDAMGKEDVDESR